MIDSTFLKEDKELMDYLNDVKTPYIKKLISNDDNWCLENIEIKDNPNKKFKNKVAKLNGK